MAKLKCQVNEFLFYSELNHNHFYFQLPHRGIYEECVQLQGMLMSVTSVVLGKEMLCMRRALISFKKVSHCMAIVNLLRKC